MNESRDLEMFRKKGLSTETLDNGKVLCCTGDVNRLTSLGLNTLEGAMAFSNGVIVRHAGNRVTYRVDAGDEVWYVKIHKDIDWKSKLSFFGLVYASNVVSPGHREWDAANMLRADGFDVASPVAFGESIRFGGCPRQSFVIVREVKGQQLDDFLEKGYPGSNFEEQQKMRRRIINDLAGMIKRFHSTGYYHKDLYCCHLIVTPDSDRWGRPFIIDLGRVVRVHQPGSRWVIKDLAALNFSAPKTVTPLDKWRFLRRYFPSRSAKERLKIAERIQAKSNRIASHVPKYG